MSGVASDPPCFARDRFADGRFLIRPITAARAARSWYYQTISYVAATDGRIIIKACRSYPDGTDLDPAWKAARAFSSLTFGLSVIILCVRAATACASDPDRHRNRGGGVVAGPLHLLAGVCQGLTLLLLRSNVCEDNPLVEAMDVDFENECGISRGGELTIGATAFWAAAAAASFGEQKAWAEEREGRRRVSPASMTEPLNP